MLRKNIPPFHSFMDPTVFLGILTSGDISELQMYGAACINMAGLNHDKDGADKIENLKPDRTAQEKQCKSTCDSISSIDQETACFSLNGFFPKNIKQNNLPKYHNKISYTGFSISCLIIWQSYYSKIDFTVKYSWFKHFFKEINRVRSLISNNAVWKKTFKTILQLSCLVANPVCKTWNSLKGTDLIILNNPPCPIHNGNLINTI